MTISLALAANAIAQLLAEASQSPLGLPPAACRDAALVLDRALAGQAPLAPIANVVPLRRECVAP